MTTVTVVLDTNLLVSALLTPFGPPGRILDLILTGELTLALDDRILAEYREVLLRPRFAFEPRAIEEILAYFELAGYALSSPLLSAVLPDPDDLPFLEVASAAAATLISGNVRHFPPDQRHGVVVVSPAEFLSHWFSLPDSD